MQTRVQSEIHSFHSMLIKIQITYYDGLSDYHGGCLLYCITIVLQFIYIKTLSQEQTTHLNTEKKYKSKNAK